jgi:hypothetical protein
MTAAGDRREGVGIPGPGNILGRRLTGMSRLLQPAVVGCASRSADKARAAAEEHGIEHFGSIQALLGSADVEVVLNITTPLAHAETTTAALAAGKHVYVENPITARLVYAQRLVAADSVNLHARVELQDGRRVRGHGHGDRVRPPVGAGPRSGGGTDPAAGRDRGDWTEQVHHRGGVVRTPVGHRATAGLDREVGSGCQVYHFPAGDEPGDADRFPDCAIVEGPARRLRGAAEARVGRRAEELSTRVSRSEPVPQVERSQA